MGYPNFRASATGANWASDRPHRSNRASSAPLRSSGGLTRLSASNPHFLFRFGPEMLHSAAAGIPRLNSIGLAFHSGSSREPRFAAAPGEPSFHFQKFEAEISGPGRSVEPSFHFQKLKLRSPARGASKKKAPPRALKRPQIARRSYTAYALPFGTAVAARSPDLCRPKFR